MPDNDHLTHDLRRAFAEVSAGLRPDTGLLDDIRRGHASHQRRVRAAWTAVPLTALGVVAVIAVAASGRPASTQPSPSARAVAPAVSSTAVPLPPVRHHIRLAGFSVGLPAALPECIPVPYGAPSTPDGTVEVLPSPVQPCVVASVPGPVNLPAGATRVDVGNDLAAYAVDDTSVRQIWVQVPSLPGTQDWFILATNELTRDQLVGAARGLTLTLTTPAPCNPCG